MFIIFKYAVKSMLEKKSRTLLILLAVALSGGLFFGSVGLSDTIVDLYTKKARQSVGSAEIVITPGKESDDNLISMWQIKQLSNQFEYIIPVIYTSGEMIVDTQERENISLMGIDLSDYKTMYETSLVSQLGDRYFEGNRVIISIQTAKDYGLKVGDRAEFYIGGVKRNLQVFAISDRVGYFGQEQDGPLAIMPFDTICNYYDTKKMPSSIYLKTKDGLEIQECLDEVSLNYPHEEADETISEEMFNEQVSWIAQPLMMMSVIVMLMSIFIIFSSFKVIMIEKIPVLGTFRSVGASKKMLYKVLSLESLGYGVIGGLLGCIFGVVVLQVITLLITGGNVGAGIKVEPHISIKYVIITFGLCIFICIMSSMIPILKTVNIQVKDIILGSYDMSKNGSLGKSVVGIVLIVLGILVPRVIPTSEGALIICVLSIISLIIGSVLFIETFLKIVHPLFERVFKVCFGNMGSLASQNVRNNKSVINSISLISIGMSIILMINMITVNLNIEMFDFYKTTLKYDINIWTPEMDKNTLNTVKITEGVEDVYGMHNAGNNTSYPVNVKSWGDEPIMSVFGVQSQEFDKYVDFDYIPAENTSDMLNRLQDGRNIIISKVLQKRYSVSIGDKLELDMPQGDRTYEVIGFADNIMNAGSIVMIGEKYLKLDTGQKYYDQVYINTSEDAQLVLDRLKEFYKGKKYIWGITTKQMFANENEANGQMMGMLLGFSGLAALIGIIGIVNNLVLSVIERKKSLAILRSVGMSKNSMIKMVFIEGIYCGIMGSIGGILIGALIIYNIPVLLEGMRMPFSVRFLVDQTWIYAVAGIVITLVSSILPAKKTSKLEIIQVIKYE